jgi:hypothetical protein
MEAGPRVAFPAHVSGVPGAPVHTSAFVIEEGK